MSSPYAKLPKGLAKSIESFRYIVLLGRGYLFQLYLSQPSFAFPYTALQTDTHR